MEQIELVIKIPKEYYDLLMSGRFYLCGARGNGKTITSEVMKSICQGTVLPKGHGALVDKKDIDANCIPYHTDYDGSWCYRLYDIENNVPTIIEADKGAE